MNRASVIPGLNSCGTSRIGLPLLMALCVFFTYLAAGVRTKGLGSYLRSELFPPGIPWPMYFIITPIEIAQVFVIRPATLAIRLPIAMVARHLMLVMDFAYLHSFTDEALTWCTT